MTIKVSLLKSIKGLSLSEARERCQYLGHLVHAVSFDTHLDIQPRPNTIILWHRDAKVYAASVGDNSELEIDSI